MAQRILLVGVGYVGLRLAEELVAAGHEVFGLRRSARALTPGVISLVGDVTTDAGLDQLPANLDQIVYAVSPPERSEAAYRAVYVDGLARVRTRLPNARVLFVSSTAAYGTSDADPITEQTLPGLLDPTSQQLNEAELGMSSDGSVVLRASGIYGPGRTRLLARLLHSPLTEDERHIVSNRIHRDDLARCLAFFIERPALCGLFNASDAEPAPWGTIADWLASREHARELLDVPQGERPAARPQRSRRISNAKLCALGFEFSYPTYREGYAAILDDLAACRTIRGGREN